MELNTTPYSFELLQIEAAALFFVVMSMLFSTWKAFQQVGISSLENRGFWAVSAVTGFLGLAAMFTFSLGGIHFIFALELAFAVLLALLRPVNALGFLITMQFLRPWEVAEQNAILLALPRMTALLAIGSAFLAYLRSDLQRLRFGRAQWFLLGFAGWALLTTFATPSPGEQQKEFFDGFFRALIVFFLIIAVVRRADEISLLRQIYLWSVSGLAGVSIYLSWDQIRGLEVAMPGIDNRLHAVGSLENANDIAAVMVVGIPFALRRFSQGKKEPLVWLESLFFLGLTLFALYLAQSRGALLSLGVGFVGWWILRSRHRWLAIGLGAAAILLVAPFANEVLRRDAEDLRGSSVSRMTYWKAGVRMVARSPFFGVGFGRYPKEYQANAGGGEQFEFGERTAHSTWILALAETGIPGLALFLAFVGGVLNMSRKVIPHEPDLFVALLAYLVAVSFLSHTYLVYPYILMGLVVAAYRINFRSRQGWRL